MSLFFKKKNQIFSLVENGIVKTLKSLNDGVFSEEMLGKGFAIQQSDGKVYCPIEGTIISVFPTNHAYGIQNKNGLSLLIHIGIDTVNLKGKGFQSFVNIGDNIKQGDLLAKVDLNLLKENQVVSDVICVVTTDSKVQPKAINIDEGKKVNKNDLVFEF